MKLFSRRFFVVVPYLGMAAALALSAWTFIQSDRYRQETDLILNQTYEIQWRASQVRERLVRVYGYLRLAEKTGELDPDIDRQMALVSVNVAQLEGLPYLQRFFPNDDAELLRKVRLTIEQKIAPIVENRSNYAQGLDYMTALDQSMYKISSATVDHSTTLQETAQIDFAASRNWFIFAMALGLGATFYLVIHQRYAFVSRRDQYMRSFGSLFAHMTRSRVTALRLFLDHVRADKPPSAEALEAARSAAQELESIHDSLLKIAYAPRDARTIPFGQLLNDLAHDRDGLVHLSVEPAIKNQPVPAGPFRLLLDELIENAVTALAETKNPRISIGASIKRQSLFPRKFLLLEIADNGAGMTPAIVEKATTPFFSTRAGNHTGLGLTACSHMVSTLKGKLFIRSAPGAGTVVHVKVPLTSPLPIYDSLR